MAVERSIRILVADRNSIFRRGLCEVLAARESFKVIGQAANAEETRRKTDELRPDVAVVALSLGLKSPQAGLLLDLAQACPATRILALGEVAEEQAALRALAAGAHGYLPRSAGDEELWRAIETISRGKTYLGALGEPRQRPARSREERRKEASPLTRREREILRLVAEGLSNKEVAISLHISVRTVENHRASIMRKLDLHSIVDLIKYAISSGLIRIERD